ncbi:MAG: FAD-dependent oxidoreductase [Pseudonocardiaceae bacterium]|nr:FAD-dependent oxidoreductase [Pseudonocardiaceae bacterium]
MLVAETPYPNLFSPVTIGPVALRNRIMSSGHQTSLTAHHLPTEDFIAYHRERAEGGAGLIVLEAHAAHHTAINTPLAIDGTHPELASWHAELVRRIRPTEARVFAQIFHNGSEAYTESYAPPVVGPSAVPTERFHLMPRELDDMEIEEIIDSFAGTAENLRRADIDGVELGGSHGYLLAQFWSPRSNLRRDRWGGDFDGRMRLAREVIRRVYEVTAGKMALGMRISIGSEDGEGLSEEESLEVVADLAALDMVDYWSVVVGSSRTQAGSSYIVPPASEPVEAILGRAARVRELTGMPVMVTSRVNTAELADGAVGAGQADVVGMTRALIADPWLPSKLRGGEGSGGEGLGGAGLGGAGTVIPCIACNQGCIGRYQQHQPIRCTVNPVTGRERELSHLAGTDASTTALGGNGSSNASGEDRPGSASGGGGQEVLVIGGGPAGISAALEAARRGHQVRLMEQRNRLGGQLLEVAEVPHKRHFPDWPIAMGEELARLGVDVRLGERFTVGSSDATGYDAIVVATGAEAYLPPVPLEGGVPVLTDRAALSGGAALLGPVLVLDWERRWSGIEVAEVLAARGLPVELVSASSAVAEGVQQYIRNRALARLDRHGVAITTGYRLTGIDGDAVCLEQVFSRRAVRRTGIGGIVLCYGGDAGGSLELYRSISAGGPTVTRVGDAFAPRALEEAIWEGFQVASAVV